MSKLRLDQLLSLILVSGLFFMPRLTEASNQSAASFEPIELKKISSAVVIDEGYDQSQFVATLSARSIIAIDIPSGNILLEKKLDDKLSPASTTKMMTALVAYDLLNLDQIITVESLPQNVGHIIGFTVGEQFFVRDILKALLINSGNDAAILLALADKKGMDDFVVAMNTRSHELKLANTNFTNPSGLDAAAHYSSAFDLSVIARALMRNEFLKDLVATKIAKITDLTGNKQYIFTNTNLLLGTEPGVIGIKTGTTDLAGEALITQVEKNNHQLLLVALGSENRYLETKTMIDWIFNHYHWQEI